jgi:CubicO group peptidase (beta-lactamase class C family)
LLLVCHIAKADRVDDYIRAQMRKKGIPGVSLAVLKHGKVIKLKEYGFADLEHRVPVTSKTVYPVASLTKMLTGVAVLMLAEENKLHPDDRVTDILPFLPPSWGEVTIRQCLSHTSGLPDTSLVEGEWIRRPDEKEAFLKQLLTLPMTTPPGTSCAYNQTGFLLLGEIIAKRAGCSYPAFIENRILKPLRMEGAGFEQYSSPDPYALYTGVVPDLTSFYQFQDDRRKHATFFHPVWQQPTAGLHATLRDLIHWDNAFTMPTLLKPASQDQMWTPARLKDGTPVKFWWGSYGLGWFVGEYHGRRYVGHLGGNSVWYSRFVEEGLSVIVLTNLEGSFPASMALDISDFYLPPR